MSEAINDGREFTNVMECQIAAVTHSDDRHEAVHCVGKQSTFLLKSSNASLTLFSAQQLLQQHKVFS